MPTAIRIKPATTPPLGRAGAIGGAGGVGAPCVYAVAGGASGVGAGGVYGGAGGAGGSRVGGGTDTGASGGYATDISCLPLHERARARTACEQPDTDQDENCRPEDIPAHPGRPTHV